VSPFARIAYAVYGNPNVAGDGYTILWVHLEDGRICLVPHAKLSEVRPGVRFESPPEVGDEGRALRLGAKAFLVGQLLAVGNVSLAPPKASLTITPGEAPTVSAGLFPENREYTIEELRESQRKAAHRRVIAAAEADTERKRALCDAGLTPDDTPKETIMRNLLGLGAKVPETVEEFAKEMGVPAWLLTPPAPTTAEQAADLDKWQAMADERMRAAFEKAEQMLGPRRELVERELSCLGCRRVFCRVMALPDAVIVPVCEGCRAEGRDWGWGKP
jgi:hypothetical protein